MKMMWLQFDVCQFSVGDFDAGWIATCVQFGLDSEAGLGRGGSNQIDDDVMANQGPTTPILGDVTKQTVFNFVPFAGAGRKVTDLDRNSQAIGQVLQGYLPQPIAATVAAAAIGGDQQLAGAGMAVHAHFMPPAADRFGGKARCVVVDTDADPAL